jgi:hypothetical protein
MPDEPVDALERVEYYRMRLDEIPEYHVLTRSGQQVFSTRDILVLLPMLSLRSVRQAISDGLLPGTIEGIGQRPAMIPRSSLIVWLGRLVSGYYKQNQQDQEHAG